MKRIVVLLAVLTLVVPAEAQRFKWPSFRPSVPATKPNLKPPTKFPSGNSGGSSARQQIEGSHSFSGGSFRGLPVDPPPLPRPPATGSKVFGVLAPKPIPLPPKTVGNAAGHADYTGVIRDFP